MIYFCADDYGLAKQSNHRIADCVKKGVLNKVSILPNGELDDFKKILSSDDIALAVHLNLIEGYPLSDKKEVSLLVSDEGYFKYSFIELFFLSFSLKRRELEKQIYKEIKAQLEFLKDKLGEDNPLFIDSHQHTHMIPYIFNILLRVIKEENISVGYLRIPDEPILPYLANPSLYFSYSPAGLIKQWLLKLLALVNKKKLKKSGIETGYFMGVMCSGRVTKKVVEKLLPVYIKLAKKKQRLIEIGFHPGYMEKGESLITGNRKGFEDFYFSDNRLLEYETLIKLKDTMKEGC